MAHASSLYVRIRQILESARTRVARSVNTTQVVANWLIGREIVEEEQQGAKRAGYGKTLLAGIARRLRSDFGSGYSVDNLEWFRAFYLGYPELLSEENSDAVRRISSALPISDAVRRKSGLQPEAAQVAQKGHALRGLSALTISDTPSRKSNALRSISGDWKPGRLSPNLSWTHYRTLMRVARPDARAFYKIEAVKESWSAREFDDSIRP